MNLSKTGKLLEPNSEARLCNHYCNGKLISVTYYECAFIALGIQHAMCMLYIVICGLASSTVFLNIPSYRK